jgi:hypothetical protein
MLTAVVGFAALLVAAIAADGIRFAGRRSAARRSSILTVGVVRSLRCADCSGSIVQHADWCGRGERPGTERDSREVRGGKARHVQA